MKIHRVKDSHGNTIPQTYVSENKRYYITKGYHGWNVEELNYRTLPAMIYNYSFSCETLAEVKNSIS